MRSSVLGTAAIVLATTGCMTSMPEPGPAPSDKATNAVPGWLARSGRPAPATRNTVVAAGHAEPTPRPAENPPTKFLTTPIPPPDLPVPATDEPAAAPEVSAPVVSTPVVSTPAVAVPSVTPPAVLPPSVAPGVPGLPAPTWRPISDAGAELPPPDSTAFPVWKSVGAESEPWRQEAPPVPARTECP